MNDLAKVRHDGRQQGVVLPKAFEVKGRELRVRREGRNLVLEPVGEPEPDSAERIPPGHYTAETLPPLGPGAAAILASVDAVAPPRAGNSDKAAAAGTGEREGITVDDAAADTVAPSDRGLPGLSPDG